MAQFLITYDNKPPRNYAALCRLMAQWKAVKLAESVWLATLNGPAATIRNIVQGTLQPNDIVAVIELKAGSNWATNRVNAAANAWLSANILPAQIAA
ncbi:MAG: hypothetical protein H6916_12915 [Novosphingobium sp.]|uniref:hypothetical protein n=1 Tax=Novosphingobium sp. TaxID=1874826 RepID=UPI001DA93988|nr:hypothetical protein [Novosphingobium sp.]MCB2057162.1 hypothetical protein [Novosphingobium sp.]MCP5387697.1 hypothetical protein [Novosphingobium sp.]